MATATQVLNEARSQVGYREGRGNNNKYGVWYGMNYQPYCAIGLTWCASRISGGLTAIGGRWSYCPSWARWFRNRKRWSRSTGSRGDIVFFDWSGLRRYGQEMHVGIVESVSGSYVHTIEFNTTGGAGNQSDGGGVYRRTRHISTVVGFGKPLYASETKVVPIKTVSTPYKSNTRIPLTVDGVWGPTTTKRLQQELGITLSGVMNALTFQRLAKWLGQKSANGWTKAMKTALQHRVGVPADGVIGPVTVRALQRYFNRN